MRSFCAPRPATPGAGNVWRFTDSHCHQIGSIRAVETMTTAAWPTYRSFCNLGKSWQFQSAIDLTVHTTFPGSANFSGWIDLSSFKNALNCVGQNDLCSFRPIKNFSGV